MAKVDVKQFGAAARDPAFGIGTLQAGVCLCCTAAGYYTEFCKHPKDPAVLAKAIGRPVSASPRDRL